jgi:hypothetical protein
MGPDGLQVPPVGLDFPKQRDELDILVEEEKKTSFG